MSETSIGYGKKPRTKAMKGRTAAMAVLVAALALAGCSASSNVSGGLAGAIEDRAFYKAENDFDYVYRGMGVTAALAKVATGNTKNIGNAKQSIAQINGLVETFSAMYAMAQAKCGAIEAGRVSQLSDCGDGISRLRFQSVTAEVNGQLINLASVALKTDELKSLFDNIIHQDVLSALWDAFGATHDVADALENAYAVKRSGKQGLAYVLKYQDAHALVRNFQDAQKVLADFDHNNPGTAEAQARAYAVPLFAMFQDVRQSCYDIRATLSLSEQKKNQCPATFAFAQMADTCIKPNGLSLGDNDTTTDPAHAATCKTVTGK